MDATDAAKCTLAAKNGDEAASVLTTSVDSDELKVAEV